MTAVKRSKSWKWQRDFDHAVELLSGQPGRFERSDDAYVAFRYIEENVRLVFYPYQVAPGRHYIRVRFETKKDEARADALWQLIGAQKRDGEWVGFKRKNTNLL